MVCMKCEMKTAPTNISYVFGRSHERRTARRRREVVLKIQMQFTPVGIETEKRNEKLGVP